MQNISGYSTSSTKRSLEGYLFIDAVNQIHNVGKYSSLGNGSGNYVQVNDCPPSANTAPYTFNASGEDLMLRVGTLGLKSPSPMVVTVTGTAVGGGALTGTATFQVTDPQTLVTTGLCPEDMALQVVTAGGAKFASVTDVSSTKGVYGDAFELCTYPDPTQAVELDYQDGVNLDLGEEVSPVPYHYNPVDHVKRKRRAGKLTIENLYQNNAQGLSRINNRMGHMRLEIRDDGQFQPTEVILIDEVAGTAKKKWGKGDDPVTETFDGFFGRLFIFS